MKKMLIMLMMIIPLTSLAQDVNEDSKVAKSLRKSVRSYLKDLGCTYESISEEMMHFKYQGRNFLFVTDEDDPYYFQVIMPMIYEVDGDRRLVLEAINTIISEKKALKAHISNDNVWLTIEMFIDTTPDIKNIFERCIDILNSGYYEFAIEMSK